MEWKLVDFWPPISTFSCSGDLTPSPFSGSVTWAGPYPTLSFQKATSVSLNRRDGWRGSTWLKLVQSEWIAGLEQVTPKGNSLFFDTEYGLGRVTLRLYWSQDGTRKWSKYRERPTSIPGNIVLMISPELLNHVWSQISSGFFSSLSK